MTRTKLFIFLTAGILSFFLLNEMASAQTVPSVKVSSSSVSPGGNGVLTIKFSHGANVKIPKEPGIEVSITGDGITGTGMQDYSGGAGDYISGSKVKYNFKAGDVQKGTTVTVTGTIKFSYCNTDSGICKMATKTFTVKVKVK